MSRRTGSVPGVSPSEGAPGEKRSWSVGDAARPYWLVLAVLLTGFVVTAVLVVVAQSAGTRNEKRLLDLRAKEAQSLLTAGLPGVQTPLASAAALADATRGRPRKFRAFIGPYVGHEATQPFVSVSLWRLADISAGPETTVGVPPELSRADAQEFLLAAARGSRLSVKALLMAPQPRIGYAFSESPGAAYVAYGESAVPSNRREPVTPGAAFSDLSFAIYLGHSTRPQDLLVTTVRHLPLPSPRSVSVVPFGTGTFTLVVAARRPLAGSLTQRLPLIIALAGFVLTLLAAGLTLRLLQGRRHAERLAAELERVAAENRWLYAEQREIARSLQHALLPESLPAVAGLETAARYVAGEVGMEIGGDWFDVIPVTDRCVLIVVGDVSGKGLRAAATMASLRFAIHAYAIQEDSPSAILSKLSRLLSVTEGGQLATVLCALLDLHTREVTLASAGHLPPLLIADGHTEYLAAKVGVPIGMEDNAAYESVKVALPQGATLLAFTDGLVERRHESLDRGLARLREAAASNHRDLPDLLSHVLSELDQPAAQDDTAIIGVRWSPSRRSGS